MKDIKIKQLSLRLDPEAHRRLKILCANEGKSIHEVLNKMINEYLDKNWNSSGENTRKHK